MKKPLHFFFSYMLQSLDFPMVTFCNYNALKNFSVQGNKNNNLTAFVQEFYNLSKTISIFGSVIPQYVWTTGREKKLNKNKTKTYPIDNIRSIPQFALTEF